MFMVMFRKELFLIDLIALLSDEIINKYKTIIYCKEDSELTLRTNLIVIEINSLSEHIKMQSDSTESTFVVAKIKNPTSKVNDINSTKIQNKLDMIKCFANELIFKDPENIPKATKTCQV